MTDLSDAGRFPASMKSLLIAGLVAVAATASSAPVANAQARSNPDFAQVRVMTQNVYDGIDYRRIFGKCKELPRALNDALGAITASDPGARAALHASQIAREQPDLLAIQEAVFAQLNGITQEDMLSDLLRELAKLGKPYEVIVAMKGLDTGSGNPIRISIWDAILVRSDLSPRDRVVNDRKQGLYQLSYNLMTEDPESAPDNPTNPFATPPPFVSTPPFANMNLRRNWMFVDIQLRGHAFRFANTHLDLHPVSQLKQLNELLEVVGSTRLPVIVTGDFNYPYDNSQSLAKADYRDAWVTDYGATCCQDINQSTLQRNEKIDLILLRGDVSATSTRLVGATAATCTAEPCSGCTLWASDHAGVVAGLVFTTTINRRLVSLLIAIGGMLLFAGLLFGRNRWLKRGGLRNSQ